MNKRQFLSEIIRIRNSLQENISIALSSNSISNSYWARKRKRINRLYDELEFAWTEYLNNSKKIFEDERWKQITIARKEKSQLKKIPFSKEIELEIVRNFSNNFIEDFDIVIEDSIKPHLVLMRLIEADNKMGKIREIEAFFEEDEIEQLIREAEDYPTVRKEIISKLAVQSKDGKFITTITRTGKAINRNIKKYAEMLLRTTTRELQTQGTLYAAEEVGSDLIQVSSHNTTCPICVEYEGKIYSRSGTSQIFPPLEETPPYHPYCLHSITVTFIESLYREGIDQYIDFSQGRSKQHPTIKDWIPIEERNIRAA